MPKMIIKFYLTHGEITISDQTIRKYYESDEKENLAHSRYFFEADEYPLKKKPEISAL